MACPAPWLTGPVRDGDLGVVRRSHPDHFVFTEEAEGVHRIMGGVLAVGVIYGEKRFCSQNCILIAPAR
jgi:hypothetical protein